MKKEVKLDLIRAIISPENGYTLLAVSNDPLVMAACQRVLIMNDGIISAQGTFGDLVKEGTINSYLD